MNSERIKMLEKFIADTPDDPFNYYALALEYRTTDPQKALVLFEHLLMEHSDYLPTYYAAGTLLAEVNNESRAREILLEGARLAKQNTDEKTYQELQAMIEQLDA